MKEIIQLGKQLFLYDKKRVDSATTAIDIIHCSESLSELRDDTADLFVVYEQCTNFARTHLVSGFSADEALHQVHEYLQEQEEDDSPILIGVEQVQVV